ncbi:hypothetical protein [Dyadobacter sp. CY312]|uniref:hypothetical protein n=1 Tax=Dyadobacter sp. CY312 TaxID=2907303 RepID=UPI001F25F5BF|nr:hypothetical protein [Dyadobacter sp. CY312]MCE7038790.1 hypothetical protein [Dyadobacter sp. CY312]
METTYRFNTKEIDLDFLESVRAMFADQEIEITIRSLSLIGGLASDRKKALTDMIRDSRYIAPKIDSAIDIRTIIDQTHE